MHDAIRVVRVAWVGDPEKGEERMHDAGCPHVLVYFRLFAPPFKYGRHRAV